MNHVGIAQGHAKALQLRLERSSGAYGLLSVLLLQANLAIFFSIFFLVVVISNSLAVGGLTCQRTGYKIPSNPNLTGFSIFLRSSN